MTIAGTIAKNTTFGTIQSVTELGIVFAIGIVLTRSLGTEQYGLYAYLMWLFTLAELVINMGLGEMSRRFIAEAVGRASAREPAGFVQFTLMLRIGVALVVCSAILISSGHWARLSGDPGNQILFVLIALATLPSAFQLTLINAFKGFQQFKYSLYVSLTMNPLRLVLIVVLMVLGFDIMAVLILNIAIPVLGIMVGFLFLRRLVPLQSLFSPSLLSSDTKKRALKYSLTMAGVLFLVYLVNQQAQPFFIGLYCPLENVGFFRLALRLSAPAVLLPTAFAFVLLPAISEQFGRGDMEKIKQIYLTSARYLMVVALPIAVGMSALAKPIINLFYGAEYTTAATLLQIIVIPFAISSIASSAYSLICGINRPGFILKTNLFLAALSIGLNLWLIPRYGVLGAAVASTIPLVIVLPIYITYVSRSIGASWPVRDTLKIALASLIMGLPVYALQSQLGGVLSLVLCIPLGAVIYVASIFALRVVKEQDMVILKGIQDSLPLFLRKNYIVLIGFMERFVTGTKRATGQ